MFVYTIVYTIAVDTTTKVGQNVVVDDLAFPVNTPQFQQDYHRGAKELVGSRIFSNTF